MCTINLTYFLGVMLLYLALMSMLLNCLLFFPVMQRVSSDKVTNEAWKLGGLMGSGVMILVPALVYLRLWPIDCWGCLNRCSCGRLLLNANAVIFSSVGVIGSSYGLFIALCGIYRGPKCFVGGDTWEYPFHKGNYLVDWKYWRDCKSPPHIVPWHLSIFILQALISTTQFVMCISQVISGLSGRPLLSEE